MLCLFVENKFCDLIFRRCTPGSFDADCSNNIWPFSHVRPRSMIHSFPAWVLCSVHLSYCIDSSNYSTCYCSREGCILELTVPETRPHAVRKDEAWLNSMLLAIHSTDSLQDKLCYGWSDYKTCSHINCQECLKNTSQDLCLIRKYYSVIRRKGAYFIGIFNVKKKAETITQIGLFWMKFQALDILIKHSFGCMSSNKT